MYKVLEPCLAYNKHYMSTNIFRVKVEGIKKIKGHGVQSLISPSYVLESPAGTLKKLSPQR